MDKYIISDTPETRQGLLPWYLTHPMNKSKVTEGAVKVVYRKWDVAAHFKRQREEVKVFIDEMIHHHNMNIMFHEFDNFLTTNKTEKDGSK